MSNLVIVESPAKANTIEKILGKDFKVVSSYGHIRDLEKKNMGIDLKGSFNPNYQISADKKKVISLLSKETKKSDVIWLATDEDREGEAIAWHLYEVLSLKNKTVNRIVFHEITENAIKLAIKNPRSIDVNLVNAQQARRVLDRIVGFKLSPILWKKVRMGLSAGRVQSVAVRLIVEKEKSISSFKSTKSYQISAEFLTLNQNSLDATLIIELDKKENVISLLESFIESNFTIDDVVTKPSTSSPPPPFTTSSLQQLASNKLGFSVSRTMTVAQKLYESGSITYMRTDSTNLSKEAVNKMQDYINRNFGEEYFQPRMYTTKTKVAQEAHEAIRPTDINNLNCGKDDAQKKLYKLIWERTICSQMSNAIINKTNINIKASNPQQSIFQSKGQIIKFDGYLRIQKNTSSNNKDKILPSVSLGESLTLEIVNAKEKYSKPPARYTEASLVKKLEELGIGRPSTYAPTISTIQKREYVSKDNIEGVKQNCLHLILEKSNISEKNIIEISGSEKKKLLPTEIGKLTNEFLVQHFEDILQYNFTAKIESQFDDVARGKKEWKNMIKEFYAQFEPTVLKVDKNSSKVTGIRELGEDPVTKQKVYVRLGKFGPIVQIGELEKGKEKPKYASLRKGQTIESITLVSALELFSLPRNLGKFNDDDIIVSEGRYGPYIKYGKSFTSLGDLDPLTVDLPTCINLVKKKIEFDKQKIINSFNHEDSMIEICNGKYGPYIKKARKNYKIPKDLDPKKLTKEDCLSIISKSSKK
tara:strand:+ start:8577 stop:10853 length:2277 start_codon:yes stop_codon:yes gene_type:complete